MTRLRSDDGGGGGNDDDDNGWRVVDGKAQLVGSRLTSTHTNTGQEIWICIHSQTDEPKHVIDTNSVRAVLFCYVCIYLCNIYVLLAKRVEADVRDRLFFV